MVSSIPPSGTAALLDPKRLSGGTIPKSSPSVGSLRRPSRNFFMFGATYSSPLKILVFLSNSHNCLSVSATSLKNICTGLVGTSLVVAQRAVWSANHSPNEVQYPDKTSEPAESDKFRPCREPIEGPRKLTINSLADRPLVLATQAACSALMAS